MSSTPPKHRLTGLGLCAAVCTAALALPACPTAKKPNREPSGLVKTTTKQTKPIDTSRATRELDEFVRALHMPHHRVGANLGPHRFNGTSTIEILRGSKSLKIEENVLIELSSSGDYRAVRTLDNDYGREVIYVGGTLFLRPRYAKFHRRAPESKTEPDKWRDQFFATLQEYVAPLTHVVELGDVTETELAGRRALKVTLVTASAPRPRPTETLTQRKWREEIVGGNVAGHVVLDRKTGAPLAATINGEVELVRKGERLRMRIAVSHALTDIGKAVAVVAPPADQTVDTLQRSRETDERDSLLKGIAPPAGKTAIPSN